MTAQPVALGLHQIIIEPKKMTIAMYRNSCCPATVTAVAVLFCLLRAPIASGQGVTDTLALEEGAAPGGGTYEDLSLVKLNDLGQVAFQSYTNVIFTNGGVFRAQRGSFAVPIVRTGESAGNGTFDQFDFSDLNNAGQVVFWANLAGTTGGGADDVGIFFGSGGAVTEVTRTGVPLSFSNSPSEETGHTLDTLGHLPFLEGPTINDSGQVAFKGHVNAREPIVGGSVPVSYNAVLRSNTNGTKTLISSEGDPAPLAGGGSSGTLNQYVARPLSVNPTTLINNSGRVLYRATIDGPTSEGLFWGNVSSLPFSSGTQRAVARDGQTLFPGAPGTIKVTWGTLPDLLRFAVDMNDVGEVAFSAELNPVNGIIPPDWRVYRWSSQDAGQAGAHGLTEIAHMGQMSPDGNGTLGAANPNNIQINEQGQVSFWSYVTSTAFGVDDRVVFRGDGQTLTPIARRGQLTPDGEFRYRQFADTAINDAGQVVFSALLADPNDENQFAGVGVFLGDGVEVIEVMRPGRMLAGSFVTHVGWIPEDGVNELGQVAYIGNRANNVDGVFLFTLEDIHWRTAGDGNWDDSPNWTVSTQPGYVHNVSIDSALTLSVTGPTADVTVHSLSIGDTGGGANQPALNLQAGAILTATDGINLNANATIDFQIGGTDPADFAQLTTGATATLAGTLSASLIGVFNPSANDAFEILTADGGLVGTFDTEELPALAGGLFLDVQYDANAVTLAVEGVVGDYNYDSLVNAADYVVWRNTMGQTGTGLAADGNDNQEVDAGDYDAWRTHFGQTAGSGAAQTAVPEPAAAGLALVGLLGLACRRNRRISW